MKTTIRNYKLAIILLFCPCFLFVNCRQNNISSTDLEAQKAIDLEVANFRYLCHLNELRADSFAQVVNEKYNYPYRLTAYFNTENYRRREIFSIYDVPYYGMTDGYKGFIFSLHKMKVKEINVHWGGIDAFWALYDWDLLGDDDLFGWEPDLHTLKITIPEHEKVVNDIKNRLANAEKERKSHFKNHFSDFDYYFNCHWSQFTPPIYPAFPLLYLRHGGECIYL